MEKHIITKRRRICLSRWLIVKGKGTQFDPQIEDIMVMLIEEDKDYEMHE